MRQSDAADLVSAVRRLASCRLRRVVFLAGWRLDRLPLVSGKMLRTKLAARLAGSPGLRRAVAASAARAGPGSGRLRRDIGAGLTPGRSALRHACAATELVHAASLCHDDFIDGGLIRRARPALWRTAGPACAILIGDLLIFEAIRLLVDGGGGRYVGEFAAKVSEMCAAEIEQETELRDRVPDIPTCLRIARGKTGPLFGFVARVSGGDDAALSEVLEEVGYLVGTAYQLADDLLDVVGEERVAGKTLGLDSTRQVYTLPHLVADARGATEDHIRNLLGSALELLETRPRAGGALAEFLCQDLGPLLERQLGFAGILPGVANAAGRRP